MNNVARLVGALLLLQMALGIVVNGVLLGPVITGEGGYLAHAAPQAMKVGLAVILGVVAGGLSLAVALLLYPTVRRRSETAAVALVALGAVNLTLAAAEQASVLSMLALSEAFARSGAADGSGFLLLKGAVGAARNAAHHLNILIAALGVFALFNTVYRLHLAPRWLGALGMLAALLQAVAMSMPVFGEPVMFALLAPLAASELALATCLLARGFGPPRALPAEATLAAA